MATGAGDVVVLVAGVDGGFDLGLTTLLEDTENNSQNVQHSPSSHYKPAFCHRNQYHDLERTRIHVLSYCSSLGTK